MVRTPQFGEGLPPAGGWKRHMSRSTPHDLIGDAITVLENMRVTTDPMDAAAMSDIEQRRVTALG